MPIIQTAQKIEVMTTGEVLAVVSTDRGIKVDLAAWYKMSEQEFLGVEEEGEIDRVYVR
jgi:TusA-related sulfurtransferase